MRLSRNSLVAIRAEAVERCYQNGIQDPYTVAIFQQGENLLTFGVSGQLSALQYQQLGDWHYARRNWSGAELAYLAGAVQADDAYDLFNLVYPADVENHPARVGNA